MLIKTIKKGNRTVYKRAGFLDWVSRNETEICVFSGIVTFIACTILALLE